MCGFWMCECADDLKMGRFDDLKMEMSPEMSPLYPNELMNQ